MPVKPVEADPDLPDHIRRHLAAFSSHVHCRRAFLDAEHQQDWNVSKPLVMKSPLDRLVC
ncbi:hypothetical protein CCR75_002555 [Bremia lactucae]|uniref:Uncharacterized protein n=1 Tax=Bremia lactucae TaxID=4779 RepID=A0A976FMJ5_BRELC|nr:hypothetical protein CCR75_002560 [Bremia lactucae]TDH69562.1 hypothetical protein CCR75_002555 [Bremia lactucae]